MEASDKAAARPTPPNNKGESSKFFVSIQSDGDGEPYAKPTRTSSTHPITFSWVIDREDRGLVFRSDSPQKVRANGKEANPNGCVGLCYCPGKQVQSRGQSWQRNMAMDLARLRDHFGVTTVVCLLSDYELRTYNIYNYSKSVAAAKLQFVQFPIIEMAPPESLEATQALIVELVGRVESGEVLAIHCRGGVGRAGLMAACMLLQMGRCAGSAITAIAELRRRRCPQAVESRRQEEFITKYAQMLRRDREAASPGRTPPGGGGAPGEPPREHAPRAKKGGLRCSSSEDWRRAPAAAAEPLPAESSWDSHLGFLNSRVSPTRRITPTFGGKVSPRKISPTSSFNKVFGGMLAAHGGAGRGAAARGDGGGAVLDMQRAQDLLANADAAATAPTGG